MKIKFLIVTLTGLIFLNFWAMHDLNKTSEEHKKVATVLKNIESAYSYLSEVEGSYFSLKGPHSSNPKLKELDIDHLFEKNAFLEEPSKDSLENRKFYVDGYGRVHMEILDF